VLALTPRPLQTAGERALFAELNRWDTGGAVRGAVVASLPVVDGPVGRRLAEHLGVCDRREGDRERPGLRDTDDERVQHDGLRRGLRVQR